MSVRSSLVADSAQGDWQSLVESLRLIADRIERSRTPVDAEAGTVQAQPATAHAPAFDITGAASIIRFRKRRNKLFGQDMFGEPSWDMLLDLFAARVEDRRVCVTSLALASGVPITTALRYIENMTRSGLIVRVDDPADGRRKMVALAPATYRRMAELFGYQP